MIEREEECEDAMVYETLLLIGAIGLIAQSLLGFSHAGGHLGATRSLGRGFHTQTSGGVMRGPGGTNIQAHGHVHGNAHGHVHIHLNASSMMRDAATFLLGLLSPLTLFSLCLGAGIAGMTAQKLHERPGVTVGIAIVGGLLLYLLLIRPLMNLVLKFASKPAETLAGAVAGEATATGRFDKQGRGVVQLVVDGQLVRVLAHLETDDTDKAAQIVAGDKLLVVSVDKKRNACSVTPLTLAYKES